MTKQREGGRPPERRIDPAATRIAKLEPRPAPVAGHPRPAVRPEAQRTAPSPEAPSPEAHLPVARVPPPRPASEPRANVASPLLAPEKKGPAQGLAGLWRARTPLQKALILLALPGAAAVGFILFAPFPSRRGAAPHPPPPVATATVSSEGPAPSTAASQDTEPVAAQSSSASVEPAGAPTNPARQKSGREPSKETLERQAVDAVANGEWERAAALYDDLSRAHPEASQYAHAARILRQKAKRTR